MSFADDQTAAKQEVERVTWLTREPAMLKSCRTWSTDVMSLASSAASMPHRATLTRDLRLAPFGCVGTRR